MQETSPKDSPIRLLQVATVACAVIALEIVAFQSLVYVNEYLPANQAIAVALLGLALGGVLAFFLDGTDRTRVNRVIFTLFPLTLLTCFPVILRLNTNPALMMAILAVPYALASIIISRAFNRLPAGRVYLYDLVGAAAGIGIAVLAIPLIREEGSFFLLGLIGTIPLALEGRQEQLAGRGRGSLISAGILGTACLGLLVAHIAVDPFNMAVHGRASMAEYPQKIFWYVNEGEDFNNNTHILMHSKGSLVERTDISYSKKAREKSKTHDLTTWFSGRPNDHVARNRPKTGWLDRRLPTRLKLGEDPDTLLVGPAAEGLTKPVAALGSGRIDAVEINGTIAGLMTGPLYKISGRAYERLNLTIGDVRTFLARTDRTYDFITLLNTHRIRTMGHQGPPEYVHTLEAITDYLEHLTPDGYVVFEERNINDRADLGIRRVLQTTHQALVDIGVEDPSQHIGVYEFFVCRKNTWFRNREDCNRGSRYTMLLIKRSPITTEEHAHFATWTEDLGVRKNSRGYYRGIEWMYLPELVKENYWTEVIQTGDIYSSEGVDQDQHQLEVVRDDKPFPYDVYRSREVPKAMLGTVAWLAAGMVLLPALVAFRVRGRRQGDGHLATTALLVPFFALLGVGYLLIELVYDQWYQIYLSSPVYSLAVVLGTMLIASGIGGHVSSGVGRNKALGAIGISIALSVAAAFGLGSVLDALMFLPFMVRVLVAIVLIGLPAFFMGVPFPYAITQARQRLSDRHAGLFFGINGALGAVAVPLSIVLSMAMGFRITMLIGAGAYLVCGLLLAGLGLLGESSEEPSTVTPG